MVDIGIDLGTTYSVVAVQGNVELKDGAGEYLEEFDVTIIHGPDGDPRIPSVFWASPDNPDQVLVGNDAKALADEGQSPIMFAKRSMGTDEPLKMHDVTLTAREVSAHILRFIKKTAEAALGQQIRRAVITHPAYFDPNQIEETRQAAVDAGFDMSSDKQLCMEPAAAAVAYLRTDERDPLRVLTYDLGGGTFDVTVLERSEGVIDLKSFDGDHLLGGFNFDQALVRWLIKTAEDKAGRKAAYDKMDPEHRSRRAQLLVLAEQKKEELSRARTDKTKVAISATKLLVDETRKPIPIMERLSREEFVSLIEDDLIKTIEASKRAIDKASRREIDEILLVGGSTHGPWVRDVITRLMEREPLDNPAPDLCVGAGAAILASKLEAFVEGGGLRVQHNIPVISAEPMVTVSGTIKTQTGEALAPERSKSLRVSLRLSSGDELGPEALSRTGGFTFDDVELVEDETTDVTISVTDENGGEVVSQKVSVKHDPDAQEEGETITVLPKPLYLATAGGNVPIAEEGVTLPAQCEVTVVRTFGGDTLSIDVLQERTVIGAVRVTDIPEAAGEGSKVVVAVEVTADARVVGTASVYLKNSEEVAKECPVDVRFPPIAMADASTLRQRAEAAFATLEEATALEKDPQRKVRLTMQGKKLVKAIKQLLEDQEPDVQQLERDVLVLEQLVKPPKDELTPPMKDFVDQIEMARKLLDMQQDNPDVQAFKKPIDDIEKQGLDAAESRQQKKWANANESIAALLPRLVPKEVIKELQQQSEGRAPDTQSVVQAVDMQRKRLDEARGKWERTNPAKLSELQSGFRAVSDELDTLFTAARGLDGMDPQKASAKARQIQSALSGASARVAMLERGVVVGRG